MGGRGKQSGAVAFQHCVAVYTLQGARQGVTMRPDATRCRLAGTTSGAGTLDHEHRCRSVHAARRAERRQRVLTRAAERLPAVDRE